jgi:WD40 repeat protein
LNSAAEGPRPAAAGSADAHGDPLPAGVLARLGTTRLRQGADVTFVSFGPGGKTLLTAGRDNTVRLWDLASGKELRSFARPKPVAPKGAQPGANGKLPRDVAMQLMAGGRGNAGGLIVALTPDGKTLAISGDNVIQLCEVKTGKEVRTIQGAPGGLAGLLFSPDGKTLAGQAANGSLFLWAADTGKVLRQIKPSPRQGGNVIAFTIGDSRPEAPGMAFTPDSKTLAAAATDYKQEEAIYSVKFWDLATGTETRKIPAPRGVRVSAVAVAPGGNILAYGSGGVVHLCAADTGKEIRQLKAPDGGIVALAFSPDGKHVAVRGKNQKVRLWETETGKELYQLGDAEPAPRTGGLAFIGGGPSGPEMRALAFSPDGKRVAAAAGNTIRLWETATGKEIPLLGGHRRAPTAITLSPDGKTVVSWGADQVIRRWDAATGRPLGEFPAPPRTTLAALSPDGRTAALANADNSIRLHETATGKELHRLPGQPGGASALAFAPDGKVLAVRRGDAAIHLYDVERAAELRQIALRPKDNPGRGRVIVIGGPGGGSRNARPGLAFSPDGKLLVAPAAGTPADKLVFFDVATGKPLRRIDSPQPVASFAFSPDGRSLATENADRTVTLWEVASARERGRLGKQAAERPQPNAGMARVAFVLDGLPGGPAEPSGPAGVIFSPDGRAVATRAPDRSVHVWDGTDCLKF